MLFGRYEFRCRFRNEARLPVYKGSTFRGVFGHALKAVVCAIKRQSCNTCLLKEQCIYTRVFETELALPVPAGMKLSAVPRPFVIEPPLTRQTHYSKDDPFTFALLLFGAVNHHLPYFIYAFDRMGRLGVGSKINGRRGQFILEAVTHQDKEIYSNADQKLNWQGEFPVLSLDAVPEPTDEKTTLKVTLKTPLRLKFKNRLTAELPFHLLTRAMLRRVSSLMAVYGDGEPDLDYSGLVQRAADVTIEASTLRWFDWKRYSARQDQKMLMGGIVGSVVYEGALNKFMPLLNICEKTHIGKQTAFGLGRIAVTGSEALSKG